MGNRRAYIARAVQLVARQAGEVVAMSTLIESEPVGVADRLFLNGAMLISTNLSPHNLLTTLKSIEVQLDRQPGVRWGNRTIDLDIVMMQCAGVPIIVDDPRLIVPHRDMLGRSFVMDPCREIAGDWVHPMAKKSLSRLG